MIGEANGVTHKEEVVLFKFAKILRAGLGLHSFILRKSFPKRPVGIGQHGLQAFALAAVMAMASIPAGAWAKSPGEESPHVVQLRSNATDPIANATPRPEDKDYASREAKAKGLEKFEGGSTTVVLVAGGSTLLIVLIVVLIVVII